VDLEVPVNSNAEFESVLVRDEVWMTWHPQVVPVEVRFGDLPSLVLLDRLAYLSTVNVTSTFTTSPVFLSAAAVNCAD
jgi:hypothetical protein